jgi:hypothetical protein
VRASAPAPVRDVAPIAPPRRSFLQRRRGVIRGVLITLATLLSLIGTVGQFYFVETAEDAAKARAQEMRDIETRTETLRSAQVAYFNAQVQANMLFALNPADRSVNKGIVGDLYQLALYDRAFPFRAILGELAIAGAIKFDVVNTEYNRLREAAMSDLGYESFMAVGSFEQQIIEQAMKLHGALQERFWKAQSEKEAAEATAKKRRAALLGVTGIATCLFLLASLMGVKD